MLFATLNLNHPYQLQYPISIRNQNMIKSSTASQTKTSKQQSTMTLNSDFLQSLSSGNDPVSRSLLLTLLLVIFTLSWYAWVTIHSSKSNKTMTTATPPPLPGPRGIPFFSFLNKQILVANPCDTRESYYV